MRLREANSWITKHNERIKSTGTLRTKTQFQEKQREQQHAVKGAHSLQKDNEHSKQNQRKSKTKIYKGFVCKSWATSFLPKDAQKNEDEEFTPFFVRKYVDKSRSTSADHDEHSSTRLEERNGKNLDMTTKEPETSLSQNTVDGLKRVEVNLKEIPCLDEVNNGRKGRGIKTSTDNLQNLPSVPYKFICSCGQPVTHDKKVIKASPFSGTKHFRRERSQNSKVRFAVALPIKQFPPINPLQEMKKPNFPARKKSELLPSHRPHTVDTATLSKGVMLVNGHYNLPHFTNACSSQRPNTTSLENLNKEREGASRVNFKQDCDTRSKRFDEVIESCSGKINKSTTPQCVLNEVRNSREGCGRHRSLSNPRSLKLSKYRNNLCRHSVECFSENRRRVRTPPHSLNSEDGDSNTDSNDTGLGSEIEYSFDGLAKLDVYLQPRSANLHEHSS